MVVHRAAFRVDRSELIATPPRTKLLTIKPKHTSQLQSKNKAVYCGTIVK